MWAAELPQHHLTSSLGYWVARTSRAMTVPSGDAPRPRNDNGPDLRPGRAAGALEEEGARSSRLHQAAAAFEVGTSEIVFRICEAIW